MNGEKYEAQNPVLETGGGASCWNKSICMV